MANMWVVDMFQQEGCQSRQKTAGEGLAVNSLDDGCLIQVVLGKEALSSIHRATGS